MPKGLLPSLREKINQKLKPPKKKTNESNEDSDSIDIGLLPSFLNQTRGHQPIVRNDDSISFLQKFIMVLCVLFLVLFGVNHYLNSKIEKLKSIQDELVSQVVREKATEQLAIKVGREVSYYKKIMGDRKLLSPKVEFLLNNINSDIALQSFSTDGVTFEMQYTAKSPFAFTQLVYSYINGPYVLDIVLTGAYLNIETKDYTVAMGGHLK